MTTYAVRVTMTVWYDVEAKDEEEAAMAVQNQLPSGAAVDAIHVELAVLPNDDGCPNDPP